MKKHQLIKFFLLIILLINSKVCLSQINGDFENWITGPSGFLDPVGWTTYNFAPNPFVVQAPGHTGQYSVRLKTIPDPAGGLAFGEISMYYSGSINPISISGFWKVNSTGTFPPDAIYFHYTAYNSGNVVGSIDVNSGGNIPAWTSFTYPIGSTPPPDNFHISFDFFSNTTTSLIGYGDLDDLTLTYTTGINDTIVAKYPAANLRPGPTINSYNLYIDILSKEQLTTQVFDMQGKMLFTNSYAIPPGHKEINFDTNPFATGQYIYVVTLGNNRHCFRINKF